MSPIKQHVGIHDELNGGITDKVKIILDAWVFGIIPESESCRGWTTQDMEQLEQKVAEEWEKYGNQVANLPPHIRTHFDRICGSAEPQGDR